MIDLRDQIKERMESTGISGAELSRRMDRSRYYFSRFMNKFDMCSERYQADVIALLGGTVPVVKTPKVKWHDDGSSDRVQRKRQGARSKG